MSPSRYDPQRAQLAAFASARAALGGRKRIITSAGELAQVAAALPAHTPVVVAGAEADSSLGDDQEPDTMVVTVARVGEVIHLEDAHVSWVPRRPTLEMVSTRVAAGTANAPAETRPSAPSDRVETAWAADDIPAAARIAVDEIARYVELLARIDVDENEAGPLRLVLETGIEDLRREVDGLREHLDELDRYWNS